MTDETPKQPACQHGDFILVGKTDRVVTMSLICGRCLRGVPFEYVPNKTKLGRKLDERKKRIKAEANEREFQKLLERSNPTRLPPLAPIFSQG